MTIFDKYKKVYFCGIGGIGMSALARLFFHNQIKVFGSDINKTSVTSDLEKVGIKINYEQVAGNLDSEIDLFIHSAAINNDNEEFQRARELKIPTLSYFDFLGILSQEYKTIAISGTHGKSTTTAMAGLIMSEAGVDPTVILGTQVEQFDHNLRAGQSEYFVVEACEYRGHMLKLVPYYSLVTNVEADHLDFYKDTEEIVSYFSKFLNKASENAFVNIDDERLAEIYEYNKEFISYGIENDKANFNAKNIKVENERQSFDFYYNGLHEGNISLNLPGKFNIYNALAAAAVAYSLGVDFKFVKKGLESFSGCWRRFEVLGEASENSALIISDYAHHPTAVKETIKATKEFYPDKKILVAYQPHQQNRTRELFDDFVTAFGGADFVILNEIYQVSGRDEEDKISSADLVEKIASSKPGARNKIVYSSDLKATRDYILKNSDKDSVVLVMGAGDIDKIARDLVG